MTGFFHEIPENPTPERATTGFFTAVDGNNIRYACFAATARPLKGTVIILPGRNECIEKYFETIRDLSERGLGSAILDWRGQGGSDRLLRDPQRGYVRSFDDYVRDLDQFFAQVILPDCRGPYYVLAHSAGATIALLAVPSLVNRIRRMVLIAPFLALPSTSISMRTVRRVATLLCWLGLGHVYAAWGPRKGTTPFAINKLTTDPVRYRRNTLLYEKYPELVLGGPTIRWLRASLAAAATVQDPEFLRKLQVPTLVLSAGADQVVSSWAVENLARRLRLGSHLCIDGAQHEILQESDRCREQFFAAFDAFIPGSDDSPF